MKDKKFLDTNVLVYAKLEDEGSKRKRDAAIELIQQISGCPVISVQILNEFASVLIKHNISNQEIKESITEIVEDSIVIPIDMDIIWEAWRIRDKYQFSYWDSMVIAAALLAECETLYSEDLRLRSLHLLA